MRPNGIARAVDSWCRPAQFIASDAPGADVLPDAESILLPGYARRQRRRLTGHAQDTPDFCRTTVHRLDGGTAARPPSPASTMAFRV